MCTSVCVTGPLIGETLFVVKFFFRSRIMAMFIETKCENILLLYLN